LDLFVAALVGFVALGIWAENPKFIPSTISVRMNALGATVQQAIVRIPFLAKYIPVKDLPVDVVGALRSAKLGCDKAQEGRFFGRDELSQCTWTKGITCDHQIIYWQGWKLFLKWVGSNPSVYPPMNFIGRSLPAILEVDHSHGTIFRGEMQRSGIQTNVSPQLPLGGVASDVRLALDGSQRQTGNNDIGHRYEDDDPFGLFIKGHRLLVSFVLCVGGFGLAMWRGGRWVYSRARWWDYLLSLCGFVFASSGLGFLLTGSLWPK